MKINNQNKKHKTVFIIFGIATVFLLFYYLSNTLLYFTTSHQFPINSFIRFPLTLIIFPVELFSFLFALYFVYTLIGNYSPPNAPPLPNKINTPVAILLPVYNEPERIVERTLKACNNLRWPGKVNIYVLDDSTDEEIKKSMDNLAQKYKAKIIRRSTREGFKAGNINNAIKYLEEEYFVILDSDQAPEPEFLEKTMDQFSDENVAFVQVPQHFINEKTLLERAAKVGTNIFYRAQCQSKAKDNALPFCGTNAVFRKSIFKKVNGFSYYTATEDIELGIRINEIGYYGVYIPEILVKGYAPPDFKAYSSQQYRWANGNLAILRESWMKILGGNFPLKYQIHMLFTTGWWLIGLVTLLYILVPISALVLGIGTHHTWLPNSMLTFMFFHAALGITMIHASLNNRVNSEKSLIRDSFLQYSLIINSFLIYLRAATNALIFKKYIGFIRTNKESEKTGLSLIKWNLILGTICLILSLYAIYNVSISTTFLQVRTYLPISLWLLFYALILISSILFIGKNHENNDK